MNRQPLSEERRARIGAQQLGIPLREYQAKRAQGLKWCFGCQSWKDRSAFPRRTTSVDGGLSNECRDCVNPRAREVMRRVHARRRAERQGAAS